jgi:hypothetical protein
MARFLKHVGKHGDRKVAIVFRQIPGEDHMCLVVYTELLNQNIHDPLVTCIESPQGQAAENLADALNRVYTKTGQVILQTLHREGMLKKVQTNQIMVTPAPNQSVKLDELNNLLNEMNKGEEAIKRLAEIESSRGLQDPKDVARRMREAKERALTQQAEQSRPANLRAGQDGALGDDAISANLRAQAARMEAEARGLLAEAHRLKTEADGMNPQVPVAPMADAAPVKEKKTRAKKPKVAEQAAVSEPVAESVSEPVVEPVAEAKPKKAGRQRKVAVAG